MLYEGKTSSRWRRTTGPAQASSWRFQYPIEMPGVGNTSFPARWPTTPCRPSSAAREELDPLEFDDLVREKMKLVDMNPDFLDRSVNEGFSGGEKKRNEILQMAVLEPKLAILDETDSGLDIDALRIVAEWRQPLAHREQRHHRGHPLPAPAELHRSRLRACPTKGRIVTSGDKGLALELEEKGYAEIEEQLVGSEV